MQRSAFPGHVDSSIEFEMKICSLKISSSKRHMYEDKANDVGVLA